MTSLLPSVFGLGNVLEAEIDQEGVVRGIAATELAEDLCRGEGAAVLQESVAEP